MGNPRKKQSQVSRPHKKENKATDKSKGSKKLSLNFHAAPNLDTMAKLLALENRKPMSSDQKKQNFKMSMCWGDHMEISPWGNTNEFATIKTRLTSRASRVLSNNKIITKQNSPSLPSEKGATWRTALKNQMTDRSNYEGINGKSSSIQSQSTLLEAVQASIERQTFYPKSPSTCQSSTCTSEDVWVSHDWLDIASLPQGDASYMHKQNVGDWLGSVCESSNKIDRQPVRVSKSELSTLTPSTSISFTYSTDESFPRAVEENSYWVKFTKKGAEPLFAQLTNEFYSASESEKESAKKAASSWKEPLLTQSESALFANKSAMISGNIHSTINRCGYIERGSESSITQVSPLSETFLCQEQSLESPSALEMPHQDEVSDISCITTKAEADARSPARIPSMSSTHSDPINPENETNSKRKAAGKLKGPLSKPSKLRYPRLSKPDRWLLGQSLLIDHPGSENDSFDVTDSPKCWTDEFTWRFADEAERAKMSRQKEVFEIYCKEMRQQFNSKPTKHAAGWGEAKPGSVPGRNTLSAFDKRMLNDMILHRLHYPQNDESLHLTDASEASTVYPVSLLVCRAAKLNECNPGRKPSNEYAQVNGENQQTGINEHTRPYHTSVYSESIALPLGTTASNKAYTQRSNLKRPRARLSHSVSRTSESGGFSSHVPNPYPSPADHSDPQQTQTAHGPDVELAQKNSMNYSPREVTSENSMLSGYCPTTSPSQDPDIDSQVEPTEEERFPCSAKDHVMGQDDKKFDANEINTESKDIILKGNEQQENDSSGYRGDESGVSLQRPTASSRRPSDNMKESTGTGKQFWSHTPFNNTGCSTSRDTNATWLPSTSQGSDQKFYLTSNRNEFSLSDSARDLKSTFIHDGRRIRRSPGRENAWGLWPCVSGQKKKQCVPETRPYLSDTGAIVPPRFPEQRCYSASMTRINDICKFKSRKPARQVPSIRSQSTAVRPHRIDYQHIKSVLKGSMHKKEVETRRKMKERPGKEPLKPRCFDIPNDLCQSLQMPAYCPSKMLCGYKGLHDRPGITAQLTEANTETSNTEGLPRTSVDQTVQMKTKLGSLPGFLLNNYPNPFTDFKSTLSKEMYITRVEGAATPQQKTNDVENTPLSVLIGETMKISCFDPVEKDIEQDPKSTKDSNVDEPRPSELPSESVLKTIHDTPEETHEKDVFDLTSCESDSCTMAALSMHCNDGDSICSVGGFTTTDSENHLQYSITSGYRTSDPSYTDHAGGIISGRDILVHGAENTAGGLSVPLDINATQFLENNHEDRRSPFALWQKQEADLHDIRIASVHRALGIDETVLVAPAPSMISDSDKNVDKLSEGEGSCYEVPQSDPHDALEDEEDEDELSNTNGVSVYVDKLGEHEGSCYEVPQSDPQGVLEDEEDEEELSNSDGVSVSGPQNSCCFNEDVELEDGGVSDNDDCEHNMACTSDIEDGSVSDKDDCEHVACTSDIEDGGVSDKDDYEHVACTSDTLDTIETCSSQSFPPVYFAIPINQESKRAMQKTFPLVSFTVSCDENAMEMKTARNSDEFVPIPVRKYGNNAKDISLPPIDCFSVQHPMSSSRERSSTERSRSRTVSKIRTGSSIENTKSRSSGSKQFKLPPISNVGMQNYSREQYDETSETISADSRTKMENPPPVYRPPSIPKSLLRFTDDPYRWRKNTASANRRPHSLKPVVVQPFSVGERLDRTGLLTDQGQRLGMARKPLPSLARWQRAQGDVWYPERSVDPSQFPASAILQSLHARTLALSKLARVRRPSLDSTPSQDQWVLEPQPESLPNPPSEVNLQHKAECYNGSN